MSEDLRYPIGPFTYDHDITKGERTRLIDEIADAPRNLRIAVEGLSPEQLDTPYRPGGWTLRQVVHHLPDSHLNSYTRFKLALTEDHPTIRPYFEARWAELEDGRTAPMKLSLALLDALHRRWVVLLRSMTDTDFSRTFYH
ncbi:MAG: putative metal-dependent hydrolase, partial [candidate division Zixibacteria bacterium]|nr:putative metal-dependent hydrolase [candidate division Zixibacteria bacterium]